MNIRRILVLMGFLGFSLQVFAKNELRVDPMFWWKNSSIKNIQLCIYYPRIGYYNLQKINSNHVHLDSSWNAPNSNYLFLYIHFDEQVEPKVEFTLQSGSDNKKFIYEFRNLDKSKVDPIHYKDNIYLAYPDRFANGNNQNDNISGYQEKSNRSDLMKRHGGDLQGIINHLDYIESIGMTALWLNPTLISDEQEGSYHGYALTDHYYTDLRLGTNALYRDLGDSLQKRKMKLIMDIVPNHVGLRYWMLLDLMDYKMLNRWDSFTQCGFRPSVNMDPYASTFDIEKNNHGWFVPSMPDINQHHVAFGIYMMQSYLWWINYAGIDGFRIDTYPYNDLDYMNRCLAYIKKEYPNFWFTGENWDLGSVNAMSYYTDGMISDVLKSNNELNSTIDFHFWSSAIEALTKPTTWDNGIIKMNATLAQDKQYKDAYLNMIMLDNHDMERYFSVVDSNMNKWKQGLIMLYTLRGIPCIYYGTEILMGSNVPRINDGQVRQDFPGGWPNDPLSKFQFTGQTQIERDAFQFLSKIAHERKNSPTLQSGKLKQYIPRDGFYTYFRYDENNIYMICLNFGSKPIDIPFQNYTESIPKQYTEGVNVINDKVLKLSKKITLEPEGYLFLRLR